MIEAQQTDGRQVYNYGMSDPGAIGERTDTTKLIDKFRRFLSGTVPVRREDENGNPYQTEENKHPPLMNEQGIRENIQFLSSIAEKHGIMGNMDDEQYGNFCANNHIRYSTMLADNAYRWGFTGDKRGLVGSVMNLIETIASRTIDNLEREGMNTTVRHFERSETNQNNEKKKFPYFGG